MKNFNPNFKKKNKKIMNLASLILLCGPCILLCSMWNKVTTLFGRGEGLISHFCIYIVVLIGLSRHKELFFYMHLLENWQMNFCQQKMEVQPRLPVHAKISSGTYRWLSVRSCVSITDFSLYEPLRMCYFLPKSPVRGSITGLWGT